MELKIFPGSFSVCKVPDASGIDLSNDFVFVAKTDEEISLVCPTLCVPSSVTEREDGWSMFRIQGVLEFSMVGIISRITAVIAENNIGVFVISTFNTDYVLVKTKDLARAVTALTDQGYTFKE